MLDSGTAETTTFCAHPPHACAPSYFLQVSEATLFATTFAEPLIKSSMARLNQQLWPVFSGIATLDVDVLSTLLEVFI